MNYPRLDSASIHCVKYVIRMTSVKIQQFNLVQTHCAVMMREAGYI
jgi:hypothetical protein